MGIKNGDRVKVHYTGKLEDGQIFDSSLEREPLEFVVGAGQVISGFEEAIIDMEIGERKTFTIMAEEAYGIAREDLKFSVQRSMLPEGVQVGDMLEAYQPDGNVFVVKVDELNDLTAILDANHPLAGKNLIFDVEIIDIIS
ncbi:MAG TPA: peptidylprolyl isomerase [Fervidobacterium sp.]|nr:peptidylprolyl isomerase [Fervidobacterium sp.]HPT54444.1 peptidylprolyl isomerase [Fervidobacterium sp.]HPZ16953.1 peptidylprolyl isomerase [Fervidobacterium sp.]HQE48049.1 peptidylprolyl isomerase [Fervidobacterium sp.]HUM41842.1 peptidylprolyl isomerase [Fervidobacterium sp.]